VIVNNSNNVNKSTNTSHLKLVDIRKTTIYDYKLHAQNVVG